MARPQKVLILFSIILFAILSACGSGGSSPNALTESGYVSGTSEDGTWVFRGIPYAAPPVGTLRWKPSAAVSSWRGYRSAVAFSPMCPQVVTGTSVTSEDCLYLNVWLKENTAGERRPVMVFIHGGSFLSGAGSDSLYNGHELAKKGVVVVTINYRLGALGFLSHPRLDEESSEGVSGNYGLLDQLAALTWVKNNISAFGGDPSRVTVFGESAGGYSILALLASSRSSGLFQQAIVESAPFWENGAVIKIAKSKSDAEQIGQNFATTLGCSGDNVIAQMRAKTPAEIVAATATPSEVFYEVTTLQFLPSIDGVILSGNPSDIFANGTQNAVPLLIGSNENEGNTLITGISMTAAQYNQFFTDRFGSNAGLVLSAYPAATDTDVEQAMSDAMTGLDYWESAKFAAKYMSMLNENVYLYRFSRPVSSTLLAFHGAELPYVFGTIDQWTTDPIDVALSEQMMSMWVNFATNVDPNGVVSATWPKYTEAGDGYLDINQTSETKTGYGTSLTNDMDLLGIR